MTKIEIIVKLSFMKQTDAEEKRFLTEYLLKFEGEDTSTRKNKSFGTHEGFI